ncbi:TauD/TfdA family dioxygenase [Streptomyces lavenduligriseus]|nr:TauD/TfdA family dioxygenase [Streptomyces lavenduligriseus]
MTADVVPPRDVTVYDRPGKPGVIFAPPLEDIGAARRWLDRCRPTLRAELLRRGHLLVRGLPVRTPEDFGVLRDVLMKKRAAYKEKATPRSAYGDDIFSSTDLPPAQEIRLHNENSYTLDFPGLLVFCCLDVPDEGGATTVADVREVLAALPAALVERFRSVGWLLTRNFHRHIGLPWRTAFGVTSPAELEAYCKSHLIGCSWTGVEELRTMQRRPAVIHHPVTREAVWFNHAAFWSRFSLDDEIRETLVETYGEDGLPFDTAFGDGSRLTADEVATLNTAYDAVTRREEWRRGDLLLVDNILSAHGREAFKGRRTILVAMGEPVLLSACGPCIPPAQEPVG